MPSNLTLFPIFLSLNFKRPEEELPVPHWCSNQILVLAVAPFILMKCPANNYFWMQYVWKMSTPLILCVCSYAQSAQSTGASLFWEQCPSACPGITVPHFGFFGFLGYESVFFLIMLNILVQKNQKQFCDLERHPKANIMTETNIL